MWVCVYARVCVYVCTYMCIVCVRMGIYNIVKCTCVCMGWIVLRVSECVYARIRRFCLGCVWIFMVGLFLWDVFFLLGLRFWDGVLRFWMEYIYVVCFWVFLLEFGLG